MAAVSRRLLAFLCAFIWFGKEEGAITVDWSSRPVVATAQQLRDARFFVAYNPPVGRPPPNASLPMTQHSLTIFETLPVTTYHVSVWLHDGSATPGFLVYNTTVLSSHELPPTNVRFVTEGQQLRVDWEAPVTPLHDNSCISFFVNYTVTTLASPKTYNTSVELKTYALIKRVADHVTEVQVYCVDDNETLWNTPLAAGAADLRQPAAIERFRVVDLGTDKHFQSYIALTWDGINDTNATQDFTVMVSYFPGEARSQRKDVVVNTSDSTVIIDGLKATEEYTFTVRNISKFDVSSKVKGMRQVMPPVISSTLELGTVTSTSLNINFSPTDSDGAKFESYVLVFHLDAEKNITQTRERDDSRRSFTFTKLHPGRSYPVTLFTQFHGVLSVPVRGVFTTYPMKVKKIVPLLRAHAVHVFWEPDETTAVVPNITYRLFYSGNDGTRSPPIDLYDRQDCLVEKLHVGVWYTFGVIVVAMDTESASEATTVVTADNGLPWFTDANFTTLDIAFNRDMFTEGNGVIKEVAVIVTEDEKFDNFDLVLPDWRAVQKYEKWPPYRATPEDYNPFKTPNVQRAVFSIGSGICVRSEKFCNGPLKTGSQYFVKIRACTKENICMESNYVQSETIVDNYSNRAPKPYLNSYFKNGQRQLHGIWSFWFFLAIGSHILLKAGLV